MAQPNPGPQAAVPANVAGVQPIVAGIPNGMQGVTVNNAVEWLNENRNPTRANAEYLTNVVFADINPAFDVMGLSWKVKLAVLRQGVTKLEDFPMLGYTREDIRDLMKSFNSIAINSGGVVMGAVHYARIHALVRFIRDQLRRGITPDANEFTTEVMNQYVDEANGKESSSDAGDLETPAPGKLTDENFDEWYDTVVIALQKSRGVLGVPLSYVVREDLPQDVTVDSLDASARLIYQAPHAGAAYSQDNKKVGEYLNALLSGQDAHEWIKDFVRSLDGRAMMVALRTHYLGPSQIEARLDKAKAVKDNAYYRNEATYSFEKFTTDLEKAYSTLAKHGETVTEAEKLRLLRLKIQTDNASFKATTTSYLLTHTGSYQDAISKLKTLVAQFMKPPGGATKKRAFRPGISGVTAQDFADRTDNGKCFCNGVDITDFTRQYSSDDFSKLPQDVRQAISRARGSNKGKGGKGGSPNQQKRLKKSIKALKAKEKILKANISSLEAATANSNNNPESNDSQDQDDDPEKKNVTFGPNAYANRNNRKKIKAIRVTNMMVGSKHVDIKQGVASARIKDVVPTDSIGRLDEDSHADMHCAGHVFTCIGVSEYTCDVDPFLEEYKSTDAIPVVSAATAVQISAGEVVYLVMNTALWFGERMKTSLFNGNLARDAGVSLCTDPYDPHRDLAITVEERGLKIPLTRRGNVVGVNCFKPDADDVLRAIANDDGNVIFLDPNNDFTSFEHAEGSSTIRKVHAQGHRADQLEESDEYKLCQAVMSSTIVSIDGPSTEQVPRTGTHVSLVASKPHSGVNAERISQIFGCGIERARNTIGCTTQHVARSATHPLTRRYRTDLMSLRYRRLNTTMATDNIMFRTKSLGGNVCATSFSIPEGWIGIYPQKNKSEAGNSLDLLVQDVGIPNNIISDNGGEFVGNNTSFRKSVRYYRINHTSIEPYTPKQNPNERVTGELRRRSRDIVRRRNIPHRLWDYVTVHTARLMSHTWNPATGRTGVECLTGDTPDISELIDFQLYDRVWFWDKPGSEDPPKPGRWLGISHRVGSALCYWIIDGNHKNPIKSRTTVQHVTENDLKVDEIRRQFDKLDELIEERCDPTNSQVREDVPSFYEEDKAIWDDFLGEANEAIDEPEPMEPEAVTPDLEEETDIYDGYIGSELLMETGEEGAPLKGVVIKRAKGEDGKPIGRGHGNPYLDTREYIVDIGGQLEQLTANQIAMNIFSQVDSQGRRERIATDIIDHRKDDSAITKRDGHHKSGKSPKPIRTTKGWELKVKWKDDTSSWIPLSTLKNSQPVEVAEYAVLAGINDEPAFKWWVPYVLKKRDVMVKKVKSRYWRTTHKFGVRLPKTVEEALAIDKETGTDFWQKALEKEMARVRVAFQKWDGGTTLEDAKKLLKGYQRLDCHVVFDVKMDGLVRKCRLVAGGHKIKDDGMTITYSSVVSRDSVRIAFLYAALNDLEVMAADIGNAYLNAPCKEKVYVVAGAEFGSDKGTIYIVVRALYGLPGSGSSWRTFFSNEIVHNLNFKQSRADGDVYIRENVTPDGQRYYEMLLVYVDDILLLSHDSGPIFEVLSGKFRMKEDSLGPPTRYLGAGMKIFTDSDGHECWALSSDDYVAHAVKNVERELELTGKKLRGKAYRPHDQKYAPETDITPELNPEGIAIYQGYMGIFRWMIELGRIDILPEVSALSCFQAAPREGHLEACYHIFAYLRKHPNMAMIMHPSRIEMNEDRFSKADWTDFYGDVKEEIPRDAPEPLGTKVKITAFVDADHAGDLATRRSRTGYIIYLNNTPILWYCKKQNTVESSTFGSEFVAMRTVTEAIEALRFKLRMFGIPIDGEADVMCDNKSVVNSTQRPDSVLSKKHLAICYHRVRESVARGIIRVGKILTDYNLADLFTKPLPNDRRFLLLGGMVWMRTKGLREVEKDDARLNKGART